jgi:uncharacterized protein (DUF983 family)
MAEGTRKRPRYRRVGSLLTEFRISAFQAVGVMVLVMVICIGASLWLQFQAESPLWALVAALIGLLITPALLLVQIVQVRKVVQVCEHGLRYVEGRDVTVLTWDEITTVKIDDRRVFNRAGIPVRREREIRIRGGKGESIHLTPMFLQHVPNVEKLIAILRVNTRTE